MTMLVASAKDAVNLIIYLILFGSSIFVNKYVLSVLNFIFPTIFQGWQTLIGGIFLKVLLSKKCLTSSSTDLDKAGFVSLLPSFLFFAAGIVASSKALAGLSIPVYLCLQNTLKATLYLLEFAPTFKAGFGPMPLFACLLTLSSALAAVLFDINMTFSDSPYFWMMVHLGCLAVQSLHSKISDARFNEVDMLYFSYLFSVVVLAPASLYLEEAFQVLAFPNASRYDFYAGCFLAGVINVFFNLTIIKVRFQDSFCLVDALGRVGLSLLSLVTFSDSNPTLVKVFVLVNQLSAIFIPHPRLKNPPSPKESLEPLLVEEPEDT